MLKTLYKTLLVAFLCSSLLILDFSAKGIVNSSYGATTETVKTDGVNDPDLMGTLTMTVVGTLAMRLYTYKMTTDIMLAAGGGAAFIAGEILAFFKLKSAMKDIETKITRDDKGNIDQKQIEVLVKLKESYEEAKKTADTKKTLQMAAAAAFAAAGIVAYTMTAAEVAGLSTCTGGVTASLTALNAMKGTCASLTAGTYTAALGAKCWQEVGTCEASILAFQPVLQGHEMKRQAIAPSASALVLDQTENKTLMGLTKTMSTACIGPYGAAGAAAGPACTPLLPLETMQVSGGAGLGNFGYLNPLVIPTRKMSSAPQKTFDMRKYFSEAMNILFPTAHAELFSAMGIASSAAIGFLMYTNASIGPMIDTFMLTPKNRAIVWAGLGALTFAATSATSDQISKIEGNITKIDTLINGMRAYQSGVAQEKTPTIKNPTIARTNLNNRNLKFNDSKTENIDMKAGGGRALPCINGEEASKCPEYSNTLKNLQDFKTMPSDVQSTVNSVGQMVDGINGKSNISGSTLSAAGSLSGQLNSFMTKLSDKKKEVTSKLKDAYGTDHSKESEKFNNDLRNAVQNGLKKSNMSASDMMASIHGSRAGFGGSEGSATDSNKTASKDDKVGKKGGAGALGGAVVAVPAVTTPKFDMKGIDDPALKTDEQKAEELSALDAEAKAKAGQSMDEFELKNDITKEKDASIFELISNRYQKSGYPRLFKRIK